MLPMNGWTVILPPQGENGQETSPQLALLGIDVTIKHAREASEHKKERPASFQIHMMFAVGLQGEPVLLPYVPGMRFVQLAQPVMAISPPEPEPDPQAPKIVAASEQDLPLPFPPPVMDAGPPPQRGE